jgi:uncharacterized protein YqiB (DUF1249 family)
MLIQREKRKSPYRVDLAALQGVCAANYLGMLKLFPDMQAGEPAARGILLGNGDTVVLQVLDSGPYTTLVGMEQQRRDIALVPPRRCQVRVYHDVRLAEVVAWGPVRKLRGRYHYPNRDMHQEDEKWQTNRFLGEWIQFCLEQGRTDHGCVRGVSATRCDSQE